MSYTTPLGVTLLGPQYTNYTTIDTNGATRIFRVDYTAIDVRTSFCGGAPCDYGSTSPVGWLVPSSLTLPNPNAIQKYQFSWFNQSGAELQQVTLPSGGTISYTYGNRCLQEKPVSNPTLDCRRSVATRTVTENGIRATWTYYGIGGSWTYSGGVVTDPNGNDEQHTFSFVSVGSVSSTNSVETLVQQFLGCTTARPGCATSGPVLSSVKTDYTAEVNAVDGTQINTRPVRITTTLDNGLVKKKETDFETFSAAGITAARLNPTAVREYDYASGAPGPLLRTTNYTYLHNANTAYATLNIVDRVLTKTVLNGGGTQAAKTTYEYDNYNHPGQPMISSAAIQHDSTFNTGFIYRGNVTAVSLWLNTNGSYLTTTKQYDDAGNLLSTNDPLGHKTAYDYTDSWSNAACAPASPGKAYITRITNALNQPTLKSYNSCTGLMASMTDLNIQTTTFTYDFAGRPLTVSYPNGGQNTITYNDTVPNSITSATRINNTKNLVQTTIYDGLGRASQTQVTSDPQGTIYTDTSYDSLSRVSSVSNPYRLGIDPTSSPGITSYAYDPLNRKTTETTPDSSVIQTAYCGNTTLVTGATGKWRRSRTDALGQLAEVDEPNAAGAVVNANGCPGTGEPIWVTSYGYDALGNLLNVLQNGSHQRSFTYDSLFRLLTSNNPETGQITYAYNNDSMLITKTDARGISTNYSPSDSPIDALHRVTKITYSNGDPAVTFAYDQSNCLGLAQCANIGHRTSMTDAAGSEAWSFDTVHGIHSDQRTNTSSPSNITKTSTYYLDYLGNVTQAVYPTPRIVNYTYDAADRPSTAADGSSGVTYATDFQTPPSGCLANAVCYTPQGSFYAVSIGQTSSFTGLNLTHSYNNRLQPLEFKAVSSGGNAVDISYNFVDPSTHKNSGHVYSVTNNLDSTRSQTFTYDQLNRISGALTTSTYSTSAAHCWGEVYGVDAWGNLQSIAATTNSQYTGCSQESGFSKTPDGNNHLSGFSYDLSGNTTSDGTFAYTWDGESQLKSAGGVTYVYDGDGRRVSKSSGKLYWYGSGGEILAETDASGNTTAEYVFFAGKRIAMLPAGSTPVYYVEDMLGTSRVITKNNGVPCYDADFYPYGGERAYTNTCAQNYKFEGKERDTETQNDDFEARYYSWRFGRWLSSDWSAIPVAIPYANLTNPQTLNLYSMVEDDPESFADLDGHIIMSRDPLIPGESHDSCTIAIADGGSGTYGGCDSSVLNDAYKLKEQEEAQLAQQQLTTQQNQSSTANIIKTALDFAGFIPVVGDFANLASAGISIVQGNYGEAALSALAAIPLVGLVGEIGKGAELAKDAETLTRLGTDAESVGRLARKAAEAEASNIGIHGVSATAAKVEGEASRASRASIERCFKVHDTGSRRDPLHRTIELPKPVTKAVADLFNSLFGR